MPFDINGKVALITGGASGIGFQNAQELLRSGVKVSIIHLNVSHFYIHRNFLMIVFFKCFSYISQCQLEFFFSKLE